ncbi:MAG: hypothetical protein ACOVN8_02235 [Burkholderiaceae bacterium]
MKKTINVMLVDDHAVVRFGFRMLLESTDDIKVVAEADSAEAAWACVHSQLRESRSHIDQRAPDGA